MVSASKATNYSDVWSIGMVIYELLTLCACLPVVTCLSPCSHLRHVRQRPFAHLTIDMVGDAITRGELPVLTAQQEQRSGALAELYRRCTAMHPADRPSTPDLCRLIRKAILEADQ